MGDPEILRQFTNLIKFNLNSSGISQMFKNCFICVTMCSFVVELLFVNNCFKIIKVLKILSHVDLKSLSLMLSIVGFGLSIGMITLLTLQAL